MKTAIATVSLSGNLEQRLKAIAAAGFAGIEIFEQDFIAFDGGARQVGQMVQDQGLEILLFQPFRDFEGLPEPYRSRAFSRAERKFDLMEELGTRDVLVCSSVHPAALGGIDRMADDFAELGERAAKRGLRVGFEALAWGRHVFDHRDAWEVVRRADHPNVGIILDSFHTLARKIDPNTIRSIPGDKIFFVQLADAPAIDMDLLYWSRHFRNMPGEGDLPVTSFMQAVMATGYHGPISLEIFNDQFRSGPTETITQDGYRSLVALMDDVRRREPSLTVDLPDMAPRQTIEGVEFIEFAAQGQQAEAFAQLLSSMGFVHALQHRNKALEVWQQGDIRLLINAEPNSHAAKAFEQAGVSVCDMGLAVADADKTLHRAQLLGSKPFSQPLSPGELAIPAIRGLGSSVLHFLDEASGLSRVWELEFVATSKTGQNGAGQNGAGLTRIDHIAHTMSYAEMLSWTLFYTALFDMEKSALVDVIDPDGLVRSQALETRNAGLRVTLNGAETQGTLAGRFVTQSFGSSVQHIALATDDIFATARTMEDKSFQALPMSDNYYHDLAARFDLSPDFTAKLRAHNILYDEDETGPFFQLYSLPLARGFFFEIVQRQGGHRGYGAANAPFRIAAQKRHL